MPEYLMDIISWIFGVGLVVHSTLNYFRERRIGFHWIWITTGCIGLMQLFLYSGNVFSIGYTLQEISSLGLMKPMNLIVQATLISLILQLKVPRQSWD